MRTLRLLLVPATLGLTAVMPSLAPAQGRARARDLGVAPGIFTPGRHNAITDVAGVRVGQVTLHEGDRVRTGITAILPHGGNAYLSRVPAALHVGNGFGKFAGSTQLAELGEIETPILLTCTLCTWKAADAMAEWMLERPGMQNIRSINPIVGETNDGGLNDIRARPITAAAVRAAFTVGAGKARGAFTDVLDALTVLLHERARDAVQRGDERTARAATKAVPAVEEAKASAAGNVNPQLVAARLLDQLVQAAR